MKKIITIAILATMIATPVMADFSFGTSNEDSLQTVLDNIGNTTVDTTTDNLSDLSDSYWTIDGDAGSVSTMVIELAGYAPTNKFGVYQKVGENINTVQLFNGAASVTSDSVTLSIESDGTVLVDNVDSGTFVGNNFGFFLDSRDSSSSNDGIFYSDSSLNTTTQIADHMVAYQGKGDILNIDGSNVTWGENDYVLAWEDLKCNIDEDYNDFVVIVQSVNPVNPGPVPPTVPVPGAFLLGGLGTVCVGWMKRHRSL